jgi:hypothetical protein
MRFHIFTAASLLAGIIPLASHAQTAPRFYVGAGSNLLWCWLPQQGRPRLLA